MTASAMTKTQILWLIVCLIFSFSVNADFKRAQQLLLKNDYPSAHQQFQTLANLGQVQSQFMLGKMYQQGLSVEQSNEQAYAWYLLAKNNGSYEAKEAYQLLRRKVANKLQAKQLYQSLKQQTSLKELGIRYFPKFVKLNQIHFLPNVVKKNRAKLSWSQRSAASIHVLQFDLDSTGKPNNVSTLFSYPKDDAKTRIEKAFLTWQFKNPKKERQERLTYIYLTKNDDDLLAGLKRQLLDDMASGDSLSYYVYAELVNHAYFKDGTTASTEVSSHLITAAVNGSVHAQHLITSCLIKAVYCQQDLNKAQNWLALIPQSENKKLLEVDYLLAKGQESLAATKLKNLGAKQNLTALIGYNKLLLTSQKLQNPLLAKKLSQQALLIYPQNNDLLDLLKLAEEQLKP